MDKFTRIKGEVLRAQYCGHRIYAVKSKTKGGYIAILFCTGDNFLVATRIICQLVFQIRKWKKISRREGLYFYSTPNERMEDKNMLVWRVHNNSWIEIPITKTMEIIEHYKRFL